MENARKWLFTLSLAGLAVGVLGIAFKPADARATATEPPLKECFYLNAGSIYGKGGKMLMPFNKFARGEDPEATFELRGWKPQTGIGNIYLVCR